MLSQNLKKTDIIWQKQPVFIGSKNYPDYNNFSPFLPIEPPVNHVIPSSDSIENLAQEIYAEHLAQISQENQPSNGFKFVHSHTPKEELLSPHSGQPLKSYSYQYIGKN